MNDTSKERSIISIALLYIKHPEHCYYFWDYADRKEGFESYILFGVVHAMANNREYRDLHDIEFTDGELRRAKMLSNSLLESLATASY